MKTAILFSIMLAFNLSAHADMEETQLKIRVQQNGAQEAKCKVSEAEILRVVSGADQTVCHDFGGELTAEHLSNMLGLKQYSVSFCYAGTEAKQLNKIFKTWIATSFFNNGGRFKISEGMIVNQEFHINLNDQKTKTSKTIIVKSGCPN